MKTKEYIGGTFVATEPGEVLSVEQTVGHFVLPNGERVQVKRVFGTATSAQTTEILAANTTKLYRLLSVILQAGSVAPTVTLKSGTDAISPAFTLAANDWMVLPPNLWGWFQTNVINEALNVTVSSSADVQIIANFIELTTEQFDLL